MTNKKRRIALWVILLFFITTLAYFAVSLNSIR